MFKAFYGTIYTSFKPLKRVEALLTVLGRVILSGDTSSIEKLCKSLGCDEVDLEGIAIPAFVDAHTHIDSVGRALNSLDLRNTRSINELKERLRDFARDRAGWILGRGWDQELFIEKRWPTRWDLDEVVPDKPVLLIRVCGHVGVVNSKAIELLDLERKFYTSPNLVKEHGIATGIVREEVLEFVKRAIEESEDINTISKYISDAEKEFLRYGVTSIGFAGSSLKSLYALMKLDLEERLRIRIAVYLLKEDFEVLDRVFRLFPLRSRRVWVRGIKIFVDGSLGGRTALLSKPYSDDPSTYGQQLIDIATLESIARRCSDRRLQLAVHAIGDRALDIVLDVYRSIGHRVVVGNRFRIEHVSVVRDDQLAVLQKLNPVLVVQPHFIITDWWILDRVGIERSSWVYRFKDFIDRGLITAFSTDAPVEPINPWETVYAALTRGELEDIPLSRYTPNQKISLVEALHCYTYGSAYALGLDFVGRLESGFSADIAVVDRDPFELEPEELRKISNIATYIEGTKVYP